MRKCIWIFLLCSIAAFAHAQSNEAAITAGGYFAASNPLSLGAAWAVEGSLAHRIASAPFVALAAELPVAASFDSSIPTISGTSIARSYSSLFITPGLQVKLAPSFPVSPYVSAGLGYARFNRKLLNGGSNATGTFAFDVGGGLDIKFAPVVGLRAELRDFNSGGLGLETVLLGRQNNLFATAGFVFRF